MKAPALAVFLLPCLCACAAVEPSRAATAEEDTLTVALCQILTLDGDRSGNFVRIENAVREASARGARLVCFPETAVLGWVNPDAHERAFAIPGEDSDRLCALARAHGVFLCVGLAEKEGERLHDAVILIDAQGRILLKHRKINILSELMTPPYTPGSAVAAVDTPLGRIGLLVCADTFDGEVLERMAAQEPDLVIVPYGWAAWEADWPGHAQSLEDVVIHAAREIGAAVVGTDPVGQITRGPWTGCLYGGRSVAADGAGDVLARGRDRDRDILLVSIPMAPR